MDPNLYRNTGAAGLGFLFLVGGVIAWLWIGRRRFNRRNAAGIEEFTGYIGMLLTKTWEKLFRVCAVLAVISGLMLMGRAVSSNMGSLASARGPDSPSSSPAKANQDRRLERRSVLQGR